jgi:hypothetical protein
MLSHFRRIPRLIENVANGSQRVPAGSRLPVGS